MNDSTNDSNLNRREFLKQSGLLALGAGVLAQPHGVFAAQDSTIRLALIGCGGRGAGAVQDALSVPDTGPIKLYALADIDQRKLDGTLRSLQEKFAEKVDVSGDRQFVGFDAYRKAVDVLRPGDVAMCTTRAYIRPVHVEYAVRKGINVFLEKPFASDPGGLHRLLAVAEEAERKNVKIAAGLQCRHSPARHALIEKIRSGEMGEIHLIRANRLGGANWLAPQGDKANDLVSQLQFGRAQL
jgi:predicted dehydrogenase